MTWTGVTLSDSKIFNDNGASRGLFATTETRLFTKLTLTVASLRLPFP